MIPRWLRLLERICLKPDDREPIGGDLREDYLHAQGSRGAAWRYARELAGASRRRPLQAAARIRQDVLYSVRRLAHAPGFAAATVLTLAVGIGTTLAIFSVANAVLLTPLPYPDSDRLIFLSSSFPGSNEGGDQLSLPDLDAIAARSQTLTDVSPYHTGRALHFSQDTGEPQRVLANLVGPDYLRLLGARASLGRLLDARDHAVPDAHPVVVLTHAFWVSRLGSDPDVIGRTLIFSDVALTVVGVLDASFRDLGATEGDAFESDVFVPVMMVQSFGGTGFFTSRGARNFWALARLADGVTPSQAFAEVGAIGTDLAREHVSNRGFAFWAEPLHERQARDVRGPLLLLLAGSAFVLLLAVANVAHLLFARVSSRATEIAVRQALGARSGEIRSLITVEALLLASLGAAGGMALAWSGRTAFGSLVPAEIAWRLDAAALGGRTLMLAGMLAIAVGALLGTAAAALGLRAASAATLAAEGRGGISRAGGATRRALIACEVALALVLLSQAHLMIASLDRLRDDDLGFSTARLLTVQMDLRGRRYDEAAATTRFVADLTRELDGVAGVESAFTWGPGRPGRNTWVTFPGREDAAANAERLMVWRHTITPGALADIGIPLLRGRDFTADDTAATPRVAIVSDTLASVLWPGADPIGKRMKWRTDVPASPLLTVVGVAADAKHRGRLAAARYAARDVYVPHAQVADRQVVAVVRATQDPASVIGGVRAAVRRLDPALPLYNVATMDHWLAEEEAETRFAATLMTTYSAAALLLAAIGIYGILGYAVSLRRREFALRVALGASRRAILGTSLADGLRPVAAGVTAGIVAALLLSRVTESLLFGVNPRDPVSLVAVAAVLLVVAGGAAVLPARRATLADPMLTLR